MSGFIVDQPLLDHVCRHSALTESQATRLLQEIMAFYDETPHEFIRRRHYELQKSGLSNAEIYEQIDAELRHHRFSAEPMSKRQIRRAIYG
ncbi:MAG: hypothetical protein AB8B63_22225 [Granulosicoccus sp.]